MPSVNEVGFAYRLQGWLHLHFEAASSNQPSCKKTILRVVEQTPPLKVIRAFEQESGGALVHLHNVSGGVLGGDSLAYEIDLDEHTEVQLTTTSATRIYRHRQGAPTAVQRMRIRVGQGALLEYLPDPIIPFANSRYRQATAIMLAQDAGLFWWESLAPGRTARDEVFAYEQLNLETLIRTEDRPIAIERLCLEPAARPLSSPLRMGNYRYLTTFYICKVGLEGSQWQALEGQLRALALERSRREEVLWGVSMLVAHGLAVRGLSVSGRSLAPGLLAFWQAAKTFLYGRAAVLPRKIY